SSAGFSTTPSHWATCRNPNAPPSFVCSTWARNRYSLPSWNVPACGQRNPRPSAGANCDSGLSAGPRRIGNDAFGSGPLPPGTATVLFPRAEPAREPFLMVPTNVSPKSQTVRVGERGTEYAPSAPIQPSERVNFSFQSAIGSARSATGGSAT